MYKKIAITAFVAVAVSAMAQTGTSSNGEGSWWQKYNTYNMANVDLASMSKSDKLRILDHELSMTTGDERANLGIFLERLPADKEDSVLNALVNNYKQASMIRDEVALARFGTDSTYAWLNSPALTWASTPGQNSWSTTTTSTDANGTTVTTTTSTTATNMAMDDDSADMAIAMKDDSSRPMRMVMAHRHWRDLNYDEALWVMDSGLGPTDAQNIYDVFHPTTDQPMTMYTNDAALGDIIHILNNNAKMADHIDRYTWYNHFNRTDWNENNG